jgi:hypothetical protein
VRRVAAVVLAWAVSSVADADVDTELATTTAALPACDAARAHCIGIQLHVTVADSVPVAAPDWLASQLAVANRHFAPLDIGFQVVGIDALPASTARIATPGDRDGLAADRLGGGVIHAFIVGRLDDVDREGQIIRGVTWRTRKDERKYVIVSSAAPDRVLAHELGHFFGLPHSTSARSIMNKRARKQPPIEQRTFTDEEIAAMRPVLGRLLRAEVIADVAR